ncbi:hypothetical protein JCM3765_006730 [Sporobolomyces pararoseus]
MKLFTPPIVAYLSALPFALALPSPLQQFKLPSSEHKLASKRDPPVPVVIWHGLGDRYDAAGLLSLKEDLESRPELEGIFVHIVKIGSDGAADQKATFFGNANDQIALACEQLSALPEITDPSRNPGGKFDAIGFSQGGQLLRGVVERCGGEAGLNVRNLITLGSQHLGISALPPCPPSSSIFSPCRLMHLSLVHSSIYSAYAQNNIIPAQYFRNGDNPEELVKYLNGSSFLRDINNERIEDFTTDYTSGAEARNETYKTNLKRLNKLVLLRFSHDQTVVPPTSSHFTLPAPSNSTTPPLPGFYDALPLEDLPLYQDDYIGLRSINERGDLIRGVCRGVHMEISKKCWERVVSFLGERGHRGPKQEDWEISDDVDGSEAVKLGPEVSGKAQLVLQI